MEGLECVKFLLQRGDWMVKSDLQYAYFLVPLAPDHYEESRAALDSSDWMLLQDKFKQLSDVWPVQIDLFASAWNALLPKFVYVSPQHLVTSPPHKPVSSSTLGHWIKACSSDAGLDPSSFYAHSTHSATASKAVKQGVSVDLVLKTVN
ncbi:hypothetical protein OUZ56_005967 [Daphnia magna]|uniref:Uncharacterized protein n=1 Tax=Daphnia magna TaxID=35525 RepID=A0ABQ9YVN2_9CRUS|nr:hypothetical protein OUZ56_005967 [Daphnia magna]